MNLMGGLQALANAGTGYLQGQQTAIDNNARNTNNSLINDEAKLKLQQDQLSMQQQQALSDRAMQLFNPIPTQGGGQPPAQGGSNDVPPASTPGGSTPLAQTDQATAGQGVPEKMDELAKFSAGQGDLTHANQLWTNAANLREAQYKQEQIRTATQEGELKRQSLHYAQAAQYAQLLPDDENGFQQWKMAMLSDPNANPEERKNIANMQYTPGIMDKVRASGMTAAQNAAHQMDQLRLQQQEAHQRVTEQQGAQRVALDAARTQATIAHKTTQAKVGVITAPTSTELKEAAPIIAQAIYGDTADKEIANMKNPILYGPNGRISSTGTLTPDYNTPAMVSIVSQAKALMRRNTAIQTLPQALHVVVDQMKANGELTQDTTTTTTPHFFGADTVSKTVEAKYKDRGNTQSDPIPLPADKSHWIPGKWYVKDGKKEQYTGQ